MDSRTSLFKLLFLHLVKVSLLRSCTVVSKSIVCVCVSTSCIVGKKRRNEQRDIFPLILQQCFSPSMCASSKQAFSPSPSPSPTRKAFATRLVPLHQIALQVPAVKLEALHLQFLHVLSCSGTVQLVMHLRHIVHMESFKQFKHRKCLLLWDEI